MVQVDEKKIDMLAELELDALIALLQDPEAKKSPAVLARVRNFLKDNRLITNPVNEKVKKIELPVEQTTMDIPDFDFMDGDNDNISMRYA